MTPSEPAKKAAEEIIIWGHSATRADIEASVQRAIDKIHGWISVRERLPEQSCSVLISCKALREPVKAIYEGGVWINMMAQRIGVPVTHWQPLPAKPEDGR